MSTVQITLPRLIRIGGGAITQLPELLASLNCQRPLLITDQTMVELGYADKLIKVLEASAVHAGIFSDTVPEPTVSSIQKGVEFASQGSFDCLVALGGGSPIDSAKAIGILAAFGGKMRDYKVPRQVDELGLPVIAIPTTAGTGSEATRFAIITEDGGDGQSDEKMLCAGLGFMPTAAILDFELTLSLPPRVTADTGIDALTHAIEAYVSRKASPYSDTQALTAMRLLGRNLRSVFNDGQNRDAREAMMLGSMLAGVAFSNASVALVHGMSRPLGAHFHVPHGLSNAMLLPAITAFSIPQATARYATCARTLGVATQSENDTQACSNLVQELEALNQELQVPTLQEFGVEHVNYSALLETMAHQALDSGSPANNPRLATQAEIANLYKQIWSAGL